ncbi:hypothetical protein Y590_24875 [Methylobacterium sp. AMS5]|nr:hypothetical protein Y590_24875 [Methylobacterium sp. AMS5]
MTSSIAGVPRTSEPSPQSERLRAEVTHFPGTVRAA